MFLTPSSFCDEFKAIREGLTLRCCFRPYLCFGLIGSDDGRLRPNIRSLLLAWATAISTIRAISTCTAELHISNPLGDHVTVIEQRKRYCSTW